MADKVNEHSHLLAGATNGKGNERIAPLSLPISMFDHNNQPYPSPHSPSEGKTHKHLFASSSSVMGWGGDSSGGVGGTTTMSMAGSTYQSLNSFEVDGHGPNTEEETKKMSWEQYGRRTLYGSLPFMAAFGMQKKETTLKKVISSVSMNTLAKTLEGEKAETISEKVQLEEVDVDEVSRHFFAELRFLLF
jgi:hypothetical protein